jgi:ribosomal protein S17E
MGRVKSLMIKRAAQQLYEGVDLFSDKFEHNKRLLGNEMPSKSVRNKIAGQIVNLAKKANTQKDKKEE